jgi:prevent-host-death family protein
MARIPQRELRNSVSEVLRRAEAGEELEITVGGRPVARLTGLAGPSRFVPVDEFLRLFTLTGAGDAAFRADVARGIDHEPSDPFER